MELFAPIQYTQFSQLFRRRTDYNTNRHGAEATSPSTLSHDAIGKRATHHKNIGEPRPDASARVAFAAVGVLNLPAFVNYSIIKARAQAQAIRSWNTWSKESFLGRWTSPTLEHWKWKDRIIRAHSMVRSGADSYRWTERLGLSTKSPLWTWITSGFVHEHPAHLYSNMLSLGIYASICTRIPEMSAPHVAAVTIGSSICASAAQLLEWHIRVPPLRGSFGDLRIAIGASGIVSAFAALVAAAAPQARLRAPVLDISVPVWVMFGFQLLGDLNGLFRFSELLSPNKSWQPRPRVGYAAHLGGALFGVAYYYAFLHGAGSKAPGETIVLAEDDTVTEQQEERMT